MPRSTRHRYDGVAMTLHWITAALVLGLLVMGMAMTRLPPGSTQQFTLYQWHKSVGLTVLALTLARVAWRIAHRPPALPETMARWEKLAAQAAHFGLYALLLGLPLSGWAVVSASPFNIPTVLYGVLPWPHLPGLATMAPADKATTEFLLKGLHHFGAWLLMGLLGLHIGAALRHHFLLHDDTLTRMVPRFGRSARQPDIGSVSP